MFVCRSHIVHHQGSAGAQLFFHPEVPLIRSRSLVPVVGAPEDTQTVGVSRRWEERGGAGRIVIEKVGNATILIDVATHFNTPRPGNTIILGFLNQVATMVGEESEASAYHGVLRDAIGKPEARLKLFPLWVKVSLPHVGEGEQGSIGLGDQETGAIVAPARILIVLEPHGGDIIPAEPVRNTQLLGHLPLILHIYA